MDTKPNPTTLALVADAINGLATASSAPQKSQSQHEGDSPGANRHAIAHAKHSSNRGELRRSLILIALNSFGLRTRFSASQLLAAVQREPHIADALQWRNTAESLGRFLPTICDYGIVDGINMHQVPRSSRSHGVCRYYLEKAPEWFGETGDGQ